MSSTLGPDVVLETLGKTESAFGVDLSHFDACEQPGINLAESSRESSSSLKVNHPQIPDFSADSKETSSFLRILSACLQVNQHTHVGLRDFIRKSLQPVSLGIGLTSSCKLILSRIVLFIFFLLNHCFSMGSFLSSFTLISPTSTLWVSGFMKPLSPILTGYHCPLPSNILLHVPFCPFTCFHVSLGILPSRRAFCCCRRCAAPGTSAFAIAWLGLALAILRAFPAFFASPSQEILSGHWGG